MAMPNSNEFNDYKHSTRFGLQSNLLDDIAIDNVKSNMHEL
jgi:hypothetical protein